MLLESNFFEHETCPELYNHQRKKKTGFEQAIKDCPGSTWKSDINSILRSFEQYKIKSIAKDILLIKSTLNGVIFVHW